MNRKRFSISLTVLLVLLLGVAATVAIAQEPTPPGPGRAQDALGTAFTYQGQLQKDRSPVDGPCDMAFRLYDAAEFGGQVSSAISATVPITGGLFTVGLDFGAAVFDGDGRWLDIRVKCDGDAGFSSLGRQELTATPYAHYALHAPWSGLSGVPPGFADGVDDMSVVVSGTNIFAGEGLDQLSAGDSITLSVAAAYQLPQACANGAIAEWDNGTSLWGCGVDDQGSGGTGWLLSGNAGTDSDTNFLGTTDGVNLTLAVNGTAALRLEPTAGTPNLLGGYSGNSVTSGVQGATIGGGGTSGEINQVTDDYGVVVGGYGNQAGNDAGTTSDAAYATVGGGRYNDADGYVATVAGGQHNEATGDSTTIGGGQYNDAAALYATVSGGYSNIVTATYATIGGGRYNDANADYVTVGGGYNNDANGESSTIGGGRDNTVTATYATIGGGQSNYASAEYTTIPGGCGADASIFGQMAYASGRFISAGDAQAGLYVLRNTTHNALQKELFLDGYSERLILNNHRTLTFDILIVARSPGDSSAGYQIRGLIKNSYGSTHFIGTPTVTVLGEERAAWDVAVEADDTNDALVIKVTGEATYNNIRWVATVRTAEVMY